MALPFVGLLLSEAFKVKMQEMVVMCGWIGSFRIVLLMSQRFTT